ncbi:MAG: acyltransferase [Solobacterium sp.]|nr:acyltransferase [Solobacterium sp.]
MNALFNLKTNGRSACVQLEGLRAFGVILVVMSHVDILNQGGIGNAIFYCLGGFLALNPFRDLNETNFRRKEDILNYYKRRALRILPVYYIVLFLVNVLTLGKTMSLFQLLGCVFFFNSYHHLWFIQQMMFMYLLTPLIMRIMLFLKEKSSLFRSDLFCFLFVLLVSVCLRLTLNVKYVFLPKDGSRNEFRIWQYTAGIAFAYLYRWLKNHVLKEHQASPLLCGTISALCLLAGILSSDTFLQMYDPRFAGFYVGWRFPLTCSIVSGICIIALCAEGRNAVSRLLQTDLCLFIGKYSFNIYLIHYFLLPYIGGMNRFARFIIVFVITLVLAVLVQAAADSLVNRVMKKRV